MTRKTRVKLNNVKAFAIFLFTFAFALLTLPFGAFRSLRTATAEVETATDSSNNSATALTSADGGDTYTLRFNYYREKSDYTGWNLWAWTPDGRDGQNNFSEVTINGKKWVTAEVTYANIEPAGKKVIGVIARKGNWEEKAVDKDTWITKEFFTYDSETGAYIGEVYMADDVDEVYKNPQDAVAHKVLRKISATFTDFNTVVLTLNLPADKTSVFKLKHGETVIKEASVANEGFTAGATKITFALGETFEFTFSGSYIVVDEPTVEFDDETHYPEREVNKSALFDADAFEDKFGYKGTLGAEYTKEQTKFTVWSPYATSMTLNIYEAGEGGTAETHQMTAGEKGTWTTTLTGDQKSKYYTYSVGTDEGSTEIVDPYARSAGRNGKRGMIVDLDSTDPEGWANHSRPANRGSYTNAIIYEAHIRDLTMHASSNVSDEHKGKFLGLTEKASEANGNKKTPLDRIKDLGVTEVHILPMYDINSVDEYTGNAVFNGTKQYNWGYDPLNYNVPEGSYSTDPTDGNVRVKELKQMVMALHEAGIRVIMDVVYNHVASAGDSNFQTLMPNYYFRTNEDGTFTSGSGCGNDTASERYMYHKFMVDSVNYWADEYQLDGFRFDLMGLHDTLTMNEIYDTLKKNNPTRDIMVYGEGWDMGDMVETETKKKANMFNAKLMPNIAFFNDMTRDKLKGGGYGRPMTEKGFIEGAMVDAAVYIGAVGGAAVKDAGYSSLKKTPYGFEPTQNINYVSCHDNTTLWDKINACVSGASEDTLKAMNRIAAAAVLTSQGPAFFLAGEEMLRSKPVDKTAHGLTQNAKKEWEDPTYDSRPYTWMSDSNYFFSDNSYRSPDSVNAINWTLAETNSDMVNFYTQLIALRKNTPQFRLTTKKQIEECVTIPDANYSDGIVSYTIKDPDSDEYVVVLFNGTSVAADVKIPKGEYSVYVNGDQANATTALSTFVGDSFNVGAYSAVVMKSSKLSKKAVYAWMNTVNPEKYPPEADGDDNGNLGLALGLGIGIPAAVLIAGGAVFGVMYSKKKKGKGKPEAEAKPEAEGPEAEAEGPEAGDEPKQPEPDEQPESAEENPEPETATEEPTDKE